MRARWEAVLDHAYRIVRGYDTPVTLRQLFYRLVSDGTLRNTVSEYKSLSEHTTVARRAGVFPAFVDKTRGIEREPFWDSPSEARADLRTWYRRDRTEGQPYSVVLGVEKEGIVAQLSAWFGHLGFPIVALRGYSSQTLEADVLADVEGYDRPAVLVYAGDLDPSGEDIDRNFVANVACFAEVIRVALTPEQVKAYNLPKMAGKATDSRAKGFVARHGELFQVEVDAIDPNELRRLFQVQVDRFLDKSAMRGVLEREERERATL